MDAKKCDRCGKFYLTSENIVKRPCYNDLKMFGVRTVDENWNRLKTYELCVDCSNKFIIWMKNEVK